MNDEISITISESVKLKKNGKTKVDFNFMTGRQEEFPDFDKKLNGYSVRLGHMTGPNYKDTDLRRAIKSSVGGLEMQWGDRLPDLAEFLDDMVDGLQSAVAEFYKRHPLLKERRTLYNSDAGSKIHDITPAPGDKSAEDIISELSEGPVDSEE